MRTIKSKFTEKFLRDEDGSATVEFAILFPAMLSLVIGCCWLALYATTVGNVQQLTYEVARQTLHYRTAPAENPDLCGHISSVLVPSLAESFPALDPGRLSTARCTPAIEGGWVSLTLNYDATGQGFAPLIKVFNSGTPSITGRALIMGG